MNDFIHLHTHSHYTLLGALPTIKELVHATKDAGMSAVALTDNGNLYGAVEFYEECLKEGIKPIIGIDAYLAPRTIADKEAGIDKPRNRIVLLAKNYDGYVNLIKIVTASYTEGFYYRPRVDKQLLETYKDNLIAIIPSFAGEVSSLIRQGAQQSAKEALLWYTEVFGEDCYLEITRHDEFAGHASRMNELRELAKQCAVRCVAAHDVYYLSPSDRRAREVMVKIQTGGMVEENTANDEDEDFSFISKETANEYFRDHQEELDATIEIANKCTLTIPLKEWKFPHFIIESGRTPDEELKEQAYRGAQWRGLSLDDEVIKQRLDYELAVISMKKYSAYFLVVGDLVREARSRGILSTIRGSVAGSLTTYVLGITTVNPLEFEIPFERFLNPDRPSAPDIDMDFADNRRDEIIEYARKKYGEDKVAQIGTFGTMMARAAVRDVARALGHPYALGDTIAKLIPMGSQGFPMTITHAFEIEPELAKLYKDNSAAKEVIDLAKKIEGKVRHISVHAAGVVISPEPLTNHVPLQRDPKGGDKLITQYDMYSVGEDGIGLLKFDFLGIRNLSILSDAVRRVKKIRGIDVDVEHIPSDDKKTFDMLARGETLGLFQLNGAGMTKFLKDLKPTTIHDVNAMVALYRPGPMQFIPLYIERKSNPHLIRYPDPLMEPILRKTYGILVYQDDLLLLAHKLAGYTWLELDKFRKAVGKKIPEEMAAQKERFVTGCMETSGWDRKKAEGIWLWIEPFAAYGFNKAHSVSYGRVAYQTAYMKANFPVEYMSAVLTAESGDIEEVAEIIAECKRMNIPVLPPDVNESFEDFSVVPQSQTIRFGLTSIKNFGEGIAHTIVEERKAHGTYASLEDFLTRIHSQNLNKRSLESLVKAGALDCFGVSRNRLLENIELVLSYSKFASEDTGQSSLFSSIHTGPEPLVLPDAPELDARTRLAFEKELLGLYVSGHPLDSHKEKLESRAKHIGQIKTDAPIGIEVIITGIVEEAKVVITKKGDKMAFVRIADFNDTIEVVVFPSIYTEFQQFLVPDTCIAIKGKMSGRNGEKSVVADKVKLL